MPDVGAWRFRYTEEGHALQAALKRAVSFLQRNRHRIPKGNLPSQAGPMAATAVRIYKRFTTDHQDSDAAMVQQIAAVLREKRAPVESGSHRKRPSNKRSPRR